jgi:phage shock protein A
VPVWDIPGRIWSLARRIEDLKDLQSKTKASLEALDTRLRAIEDRLTRMEADREQVVVEARAAAGIAATGLAASMLGEVVTRVEMRLEDTQRRLPG